MLSTDDVTLIPDIDAPYLAPLFAGPGDDDDPDDDMADDLEDDFDEEEWDDEFDDEDDEIEWDEDEMADLDETDNENKLRIYHHRRRHSPGRANGANGQSRERRQVWLHPIRLHRRRCYDCAPRMSFASAGYLPPPLALISPLAIAL